MDTDQDTALADCSVVELRQYTLHPGARDDLIELFDREFVETQEAAGIQVIGQFRDLDDPDRFVWLRGFANMDARRSALAAFYGGPVWAEHRDAANATMIDSDDVLLLRPLAECDGCPPTGARRPVGASGSGPGVVVATVHILRSATDAAPRLYTETMVPALTRAGIRPIAAYVTDPSPNTFPSCRSATT